MSARDQGFVACADHQTDRCLLKGLRVDYVDLYQCHRYDAATALEETMQALTDVVRQGKLRSYGAALRELGFTGRHDQGLLANNRAENSHQPLR
jgi:hypothetical protein